MVYYNPGAVLCFLSIIIIFGHQWIDVQANISPNSLNEDRSLERLFSRDWVRIYAGPPRLVSVFPGETVELECEAIGAPPPQIRWSGPSGPLINAPMPVLENSLEERAPIGGIWRVRSRLVLNCPSQGMYTCHSWAASSQESSAGSMVMVNLSGGRVNPVCEESSIMPPRIVLWAPVILELMGHNVTLPCSAIGQPSPSIRWLDDDGLPIGSPLNHGTGRYRQLPNGNLEIQSLRWNDMGGYTCVAETFNGGLRDGPAVDMATTFVYPVMPE